jgi:hypothetical protein
MGVMRVHHPLHLPGAPPRARVHNRCSSTPRRPLL